MKSSIAAIFLLLIVTVIPRGSTAAEPECRSIHDIGREQGVMWLQGTLASQENLVSCIDEAWLYFDYEAQLKSAEFVHHASSQLLSAMQFNVTAFIHAMESRPALLTKWLENIRSTVFTWREEPPCGRQAQIDEIRALLDSRKAELSNSTIFQEIDDAFQELSCNMID